MRVPFVSRLSLLAALAAAGCAPVPAAAPAAGLFGGGVRVSSRLALQDRGGFRLLNTAPGVTAYERADVAYLRVYLRRADGDEVRLGDFTLGDAPLVIENLRMDTTYAVRLEAYKADDTRIDANADDDDDDAEGCETSFTTTNVQELDLTAAMNPFKLKLLDQAFNGTAGGAVEVTPGEVTQPIEAERLPLSGLFDLAGVRGAGAIAEAPAGALTLTLGAGASHLFQLRVDLPADVTTVKSGAFRLTFDPLPSQVRMDVGLGAQAAITSGDFAGLPRFAYTNLPGNGLAMSLTEDGTLDLFRELEPNQISNPASYSTFVLDYYYRPADADNGLPAQFSYNFLPVNGDVFTTPLSGYFDIATPVPNAAYGFGFKFTNQADSPVVIRALGVGPFNP